MVTHYFVVGGGAAASLADRGVGRGSKKSRSGTGEGHPLPTADSVRIGDVAARTGWITFISSCLPFLKLTMREDESEHQLVVYKLPEINLVRVASFAL
jgi:hypothetical protein